MEFCNQALKAGHSLIIFARAPNKLPPNIKDSPKVSTIQGKFTDAKDREKAVKSGADVLVTFMGPVTMSSGAVSGNSSRSQEIGADIYCLSRPTGNFTRNLCPRSSRAASSVHLS